MFIQPYPDPMPFWSLSVQTQSLLPLPSPCHMDFGTHVLLAQTLDCDCDHPCLGPRKPGKPRTGLPTSASQASLSQEPGWKPLPGICHELIVVQVTPPSRILTVQDGTGEAGG
jgi:hypothetical protein